MYLLKQNIQASYWICFYLHTQWTKEQREKGLQNRKIPDLEGKFWMILQETVHMLLLDAISTKHGQTGLEI